MVGKPPKKKKRRRRMMRAVVFLPGVDTVDDTSCGGPRDSRNSAIRRTGACSSLIVGGARRKMLSPGLRASIATRGPAAASLPNGCVNRALEREKKDSLMREQIDLVNADRFCQGEKKKRKGGEEKKSAKRKKRKSWREAAQAHIS